MNTYNKVGWIIAIIIWIFSLILLIIALTNLVPENPFKKYGLIIGIWLIVITAFMRRAYNKQKKEQSH